MSRARDTVKIPEPMQTLRPEDMKRADCPVPREPGVYVAWITTDDALEQLGVEGPAPVVAYIGKAGPTSQTKGKTRTLLDRLREHVRQPGQQDCYPFFELAELLGVRRTILLPIWHRCHGKISVSKYRSRPSPLGQLSIDQALAWQYENLVWGWMPLPADQVNSVESALIKEHLPLLNHRGMPTGSPPPQLRRIGPYESDRARWLGLYGATAAASCALRDDESDGTYTVDDRGWPVVTDSQETNDTIFAQGPVDIRTLHFQAGLMSPDESSWGEPLVDAWERTFTTVPDDVPPGDWFEAMQWEEAFWIAAAGFDGSFESLLGNAADPTDIVRMLPTQDIVTGLLALMKKWTSWERH